MPQPDTSLLTAALAGYEQQAAEIRARIVEIQKLLGSRKAQTSSPDGPMTTLTPRRRMSAAARKRIAEAQRKRWAAYRRKNVIE